MNILYDWIRINWDSIWGHGVYLTSKTGDKSGFYVVVPVDLLAAHFDCLPTDIIYGKED